MARAVGLALALGAAGAHAATITVTTNADEAIPTVNGNCTLREAVQAANTNAAVDACAAGAAGADTILFNAGLGAITLTQGELTFSETLSITGPAAGQTIDGNYSSRIFRDTSVSTIGLSLTNLTLQNGNGNGTSSGGAIIVSNVDLSLTNSTLSGNYAVSNRDGGAIYAFRGSVTLTDSTVSGNGTNGGGTVVTRHGGGIYTYESTLTLANSVVSGNSATDVGGGIAAKYTTLTVGYSTISGNSANSRGGGLGLNRGGSATFTNSTISGNSAYLGGGVWEDQLTGMVFNNTTISNNSATGPGSYGKGGGILANNTVTFNSTILSGNSAAGTSGGANFSFYGSSPTVNASYSLLGTDVTVTGTNTNNQVNNNPDLNALADNGCATPAGAPATAACVQTMEPNLTSPAIDNGFNPQMLTYDQRANVARAIDGNLDPADAPNYAVADIGAHEVEVTDFGDAPASYGEAEHAATISVSLGTFTLGDVDHEAANQPSASANGDDTDGNDDETSAAFMLENDGAGTNISADVSVVNDSGAAVTLCGWLNFWDAMGSLVNNLFDNTAERVCTTVADNNGSPTTSTLNWNGLPTANASITTFARFRVCSTASECNAPTGTASDGEVEDYQISLNPTSATIGDVALDTVPVAQVIGPLEGTGAAEALALLQSWYPETPLSADADGETIRQALSNYLDPDGDGHVARFSWNTLEERGTVGFYAERSSDHGTTWQRLNGDMLPGLIDAPLGGEYRLFDPTALPKVDYQYRLIEQEAWGSQKTYGPYWLRAE